MRKPKNICVLKARITYLSRSTQNTVRGEGGSAHRAPPATTDKNKSTKTCSAWGGKVAELSEDKG